MLRLLATKLPAVARQITSTGVRPSAAASIGSIRQCSHGDVESPEEFDQRFIDFFNQPDLDGWLVRKGLTELHHHDNIPEPKIIIAALQAIRRVNDHALAIRFLESVRTACGSQAKTIYPWILQEIRPTLDELGISSPDELGYTKPELWLPLVDYWEWDQLEGHYAHSERGRKNFQHPDGPQAVIPDFPHYTAFSH